MNRLSPFIRFPGNNQGSALLITLAALVLLTVLILAFFSHSLLNQQISVSNTNQVRADQLARSALEIVKGEIRQEIADPTYSTPGYGSGGSAATCPAVYQPLNATATVPELVNANPSIVGLSSPTTPYLVGVSANNTVIDPGTNGRTMGSSVLISTPSLNGRYLSSDYWFGSGGPQLGSNSNVPTWVYVTRGGIQTPILSSVADPTSSGYVIGRFAYTVYDQGALMDVNLAGYPAAVTAIAAMAPFKPSLAFADLTQIPGMSSTGVASLTTWRNPTTAADTTGNTFTEWAAGLVPSGATVYPAAMAAAASGNLSSVAGDNTFFSRQDLLLAAKNGLYGLTTSEAGYLTHFSRALNAPSWAPTNAPSYNAPTDWTAANPTNPDLSGGGSTGNRVSAAATITHYDDSGNSSTYQVLPGDSLLQRRYSLAKVGWITASGIPTSGLYATVSTTALQACFGLVWNSAQSRWDYDGPSGTTLQSSIETLSQVAAETTPREPNFFELLKAGILAGSVGNAGTYSPVSDVPQQNLDAIGDFQILQIGLNIIDCARADDYPTTAALSTKAGDGTTATATVAHGVKDLPYLYAMQSQELYNESYVNPTTNQLNSATLLLIPYLFSPHAPSPIASSVPANIRIRIATGMVQDIGLFGVISGSPPTGGYTGQAPAVDNVNINLATTTTPIVLPSTSFTHFRSGVQTVRNNYASSSTTLSTLVPASQISTSDNDINGFLVYQAPTGTPPQFQPMTSPPTAPNFGAHGSTDFLIVLEYQDASNVWHIYDTLTGNEAFASTGNAGWGTYSTDPMHSGIGFGPPMPQVAGPLPTGSYCKTINVTGASTSTTYGPWKIDPRTTRYGLSAAGYGCQELFPITGAPASWLLGKAWWGGLFYFVPFGPSTETVATQNIFYPGNWLTWNTGASTRAVWTPTSYADNVADGDGFARPPDGWLGSGANFLTTTAPRQTYTVPATYTTTGSSAGRPIILHRPYRSVAELGYVFRSSPWKTLDFFDYTSGDGALLDLFSVSDQPALVAGRIALNSPQAATQTALLSGVGQAADGTSTASATTASSIAASYQSYAYSSYTPTATMPINAALLPSFMNSSSLTSAYPTSSTPIKYYRESVVRALTAGTQSRTWNLLIDVAAQVGRFPSGTTPTSLANFIVEGGKRYWLSVSIDRYTGKVIDEQWEPVNQ